MHLVHRCIFIVILSSVVDGFPCWIWYQVNQVPGSYPFLELLDLCQQLWAGELLQKQFADWTGWTMFACLNQRFQKKVGWWISKGRITWRFFMLRPTIKEQLQLRHELQPSLPTKQNSWQKKCSAVDAHGAHVGTTDLSVEWWNPKCLRLPWILTRRKSSHMERSLFLSITSMMQLKGAHSSLQSMS